MVRVILALVVGLSLAGVARADDSDDFASRKNRFQTTSRSTEASHAWALSILVEGRDPEAVDAVLAEIRSRATPGIWAHGILALEKLDDAESMDRFRNAMQSSSVLQRTAVVLAVRNSRNPKARSILAAGLIDADAAVRTAAVHAFGDVSHGPFGLEVLRDSLADAGWTVRAAAVAGLRRRPLEESAGPLVTALARETRGRVREDIFEALRKISGLDFGDDVDLWASWWKTRRAPPTGEIEYAKPRYYGLPIVGDRPVFVLDASGSMEAVALLSAEETARLVPDRKAVNKLELAMVQLERALASLPKTLMFGIVTYSDEANAWRTAFDPATPERVRAATASLASVKPTGGTNIYDSLVKGVLLGCRGGFLDDLDTGADQILFLTDGIPSTGTFQQGSEILDVLGLLCAVRRVRIDGVGIGRHDYAFMRNISTRNGGQYIAVGR
jgi:hypothetical protein